MYLELILFVLLGLFILLFVSTPFLEKQRIHDFVPTSPGQERWVSTAFRFQGKAPEGWRSPGRRRVAESTQANARTTWLRASDFFRISAFGFRISDLA